jgi:hypothetical protein
VYCGLLKQSDLTSTSSSSAGRASATVAVLFDFEHIQVTMVSELEVGAKYYLDLIDDELAYTCWRQFTEHHDEPELSN